MDNPIENIYKLSTKIANDFAFLHDYNYKITDVNFKKLETPDGAWMLGPCVEIVYANDKNRWICATLYKSGLMFVTIKDFTVKKSFSYDDFITYKYNKKISFAYKMENRTEAYADYYNKMVQQSFTNELKEVLLGNAWIDVPFDWQGMK